MNIETIITNVTNRNVRYEYMGGREYIAVPMTMLTEGVHTGSGGALYYPGAELAKNPVVWNMKPVVIYHPANGGTATNPTELATRQVGIIMNAKWTGKLKAEAWLDPERLAAVEPSVLEALEKNLPMEVSTGLFTDNEPAPGVWNGRPYDYVARNYRPDHLAILPTGVGACSVAAGCGLLQLNQGVKPMHEEQPYVAPTMNFDAKPCGCGKGHPTNDNGPVVAPACWPVPTHQPTANTAAGGGQGAETPLPILTTG